MTKRRAVTDPEAVIFETLSPHVDEWWELFLFGSRARGDAKRTSDWDIWVRGPWPMSCEMNRSLRSQIYDLPWNIDLVDFAYVSEEFLEVVEREM